MPETYSGCCADRRRRPCSSAPSVAAASRPKARASPYRRERIQRGSAAVDGHVRRPARGPDRRSPTRWPAGSGGRDRGRSAMSPELITVVLIMAGVLARAVHGHGVLRAAGADRRLPGRVVERPVGRGLQRRLVEPGSGEDAADAVEVERLAGVRRAGQGQQLAVEIEPGAQHADGLQRLAGAARIHRGELGARPRSSSWPSGPVTATRPRCTLSTKPWRTTSTRIGSDLEGVGHGSDASRDRPPHTTGRVCREANVIRMIFRRRVATPTRSLP